MKFTMSGFLNLPMLHMPNFVNICPVVHEKMLTGDRRRRRVATPIDHLSGPGDLKMHLNASKNAVVMIVLNLTVYVQSNIINRSTNDSTVVHIYVYF